MELDKERQGLGLSLAGNRDRSRLSIFVVGLHPGGPAARDGRIRVGDELLEVRQLPSCDITLRRPNLNRKSLLMTAEELNEPWLQCPGLTPGQLSYSESSYV